MLPLNTPEEAYGKMKCYSRSKLANAMYAHHLAKRLEADGIKTASVHPGVVKTELFRHMQFFQVSPWFFILKDTSLLHSGALDVLR